MLSDNQEGWDGVENGREVQEERTYVYLWQIHAAVWQKSTQYCKAITFQLKINKIKKIFSIDSISSFSVHLFVCSFRSLCFFTFGFAGSSLLCAIII